MVKNRVSLSINGGFLQRLAIALYTPVLYKYLRVARSVYATQAPKSQLISAPRTVISGGGASAMSDLDFVFCPNRSKEAIL
jgi:hypothetical protein